MPKSRVFAILSLVALTVVLAACGNEEEAEPTSEPTVAEETVAPTVEPEETTEATTSVAASPSAASVTDSSEATPIAATAPGQSESTPVGSATTASSTPVTEAVSTSPVEGTVVFNGAEQRDYLVTEEGCMGLGEWSQLQPGAQVIVRDASGTVVDISTLTASETADGCSWNVELDVPDSEFVSIGIPMVTEVWFNQADLQSGTVEITIP